MIEFDRHLEILLLSNDCVIVPGFGGFMAHHVDASYDEADKTFLPPLRTLGFNPQLKMNDSLLAQSYIEAYDISYPEAISRIEEEVSELHQYLDNDGFYELNDIGTLKLNEEGSLLFEPCEAGILTPSLYGLSSFQMKLLEQKDIESEASIAVTLGEEKEPSQTVIEENDITIKMSWVRNVVAVAAAVLAFFMIGSPISNSSIQQSSFIRINSNPVQHSDSQSNINNDNSIFEIPESTLEKRALPIEEITSEATQTLKNKEYTLVLASDVAKKNADHFIEKLEKDGLKEARIQKTTMTRVVYGSYDTETEAYNALQILRKQSRHFKEAWVMKINK